MIHVFQALRIKIQNGQTIEVTEVYSNDGSELSGSSVAVVHKNSLLLGSVVSHCLYCQLEGDKPVHM